MKRKSCADVAVSLTDNQAGVKSGLSPGHRSVLEHLPQNVRLSDTARETGVRISQTSLPLSAPVRLGVYRSR